MSRLSRVLAVGWEAQRKQEAVFRSMQLQGENTAVILDDTNLDADALSKIFKAGKNGTVHLKTLVLNNCGIDDGLMGILGQALYDALFTANNRINNSFNNRDHRKDLS